MSPTKREREILESAEEFLRENGLDKDLIHRHFYFRYVPMWKEWEERMRELLFGRPIPIYASSDKEFEEGLRWQAKVTKHLRTFVLPQLNRAYQIEGDRHSIQRDVQTGGYYARSEIRFVDAISQDEDPDLWDRLYEPDDGRPLSERGRDLAPEERNAIHSERMQRLRTIVKFISEVRSFAIEFQMDFDNLLYCLISGGLPKVEDVGEFLWRLNPRTSGIVDNVRRNRPPYSFRARKGGRPAGQEGMDKETIIRTWAIFLLTKGGGGTRPQAQAIKIWDTRFPQYEIGEDVVWYKRDLSRMLPAGGPRKKSPFLTMRLVPEMERRQSGSVSKKKSARKKDDYRGPGGKKPP